jgi:hypothetical protein
LVTIGILFALRGQSQRRFYQWLWCNFGPLFPNLPERSRLFRLLRGHQNWSDRFLAQPSLINFSDSLGIELIHPHRQGRTKNQVGKKGKSIRNVQARRNGRWIVGVKFCPLVNGAGRVVDWDADPANMYDGDFQRLLKHYSKDGKMTDKGFHRMLMARLTDGRLVDKRRASALTDGTWLRVKNNKIRSCSRQLGSA